MTPEEIALAIDYLRAAAKDAQDGKITITHFDRAEDGNGLIAGFTIEWDNGIDGDETL